MKSHSKPLRVTNEDATALPARPERTEDSGPWTRDFGFDIESEGDDVVVVWSDSRAEAPGYYGGRFTCRRVETD